MQSTTSLRSSRRMPHRTGRSGFTLIELLVVIVIIAAIVAMLLPAVWSAQRRVRIGRVRTELSQLEGAIATFKAQFNVEPPSYIDFTRTSGQYPAATRAALRQIWPNMDLNTANYMDGQVLDGAACLVFFLGGVPDGGSLTGFSTNPANPFASGGSRIGPFYDFDGGRLTGTAPYYTGYFDSYPGQASPIVYFSSYDGRGYQPGDNISNMAVFYTTTGTTPHKQNSFQLISPGPDGQHGTGGPYTEANADSLLIGPRLVERDNITNFTSGELRP